MAERPRSSSRDDEPGTEMHRFASLNTSVLEEDDGSASDATLLRATSPSPKPMEGYGNVSGQRRRHGVILFQGVPLAPGSLFSQREVEQLERGMQNTPDVLSMESLFNFIWMLLIGWTLALAYLCAAILLFLTVVGLPYGQHCLRMAYFCIWPYNKYLTRVQDGNRGVGSSVVSLTEANMLGFLAYSLISAIVLIPTHVLNGLVGWGLVVYMPMFKANKAMLPLLFAGNPLDLRITSDPMGDTQLCVHSSLNWMYYRYQVWGVDLIVLNLLPAVPISVFIGYVVPLFVESSIPEQNPYPLAMFMFSCISIVPLSYFISLSVERAGFLIGALINASFGSIIELILYAALLRKETGPDKLIQYAVTGSLLASLLLLPGLSMICGGLRFKEQRFSARAAGVSSVLLIISIIGAFTPTVFYQIYGKYHLQCASCFGKNDSSGLNCGGCEFVFPKLESDSVYIDHVRPLMHWCASLLPVAYICGLLFTLKTHEHLFRRENREEAEEHHTSRWSIRVAACILLVSVALFALISEEMVDAMNEAFAAIGVRPAFAGLTFFAIVPALAEYAAAIMFALQDDISLSIEIASSSAIQLALIQVPVLVWLSFIFQSGTDAFTLVFPALDLFAAIFAVIIVNYVSIDGRANYFIGVALIIIWILLLGAFFNMPDPEKAD